MHPASPTDPMVLKAFLTAKSDKHGELHQTLFSLLGGIQGEPGCLECRAGQELGEEPHLHLSIVWKDRQALETFMGAEVFRILLGALQVLAVSTEFRIAAAEVPVPGDPHRPAPSYGSQTLASLPGPP